MIWVIGDRRDDACCEIARKRVEALGDQRPDTVSLAEAMLEISESLRPKCRR